VTRQVHGERAEPVAAFVVFACNGGQRGVTMALGRGQERSNPRVIRAEPVRDAFEHPGSAEIEAIQVRQLRVGTVCDHTRR